MTYAKPSLTVDLNVYRIYENNLELLLIKRKLDPFKGSWALPGGFVSVNESLETAAKRELEEETGIKKVYLEQLYTFGDVKRDPRGRVITVAYFALLSKDVKVKAASDALEAKWFSIEELPKLAFDHKKIITYSLKRLKWKFEYTPIAFTLLHNKFTLTDLQKVYETVFDKKFDKRNFRKKITSLNILEEKDLMEGTSYRPPMLYSLKKNIPQIINIL